MDLMRYEEMRGNVEAKARHLAGREVFLFGHCEASLALADLLAQKGIGINAILDNSKEKQGKTYRGIPVIPPESAASVPPEKSSVLIATRFYEAMNAQLRKLGYRGEIVKLVDFNSYAEYSLSEETRAAKRARVMRGVGKLRKLKEKHENAFLVFCPFNALGDVYFCMSYLPAFLEAKGKKDYAVCVPSVSCASVAKLFGAESAEVIKQSDLDEIIQAVIYTRDKDCFIAHQDRPYVVSLHKALQMRKIPLEEIYRCGVFGLPESTEPAEPSGWEPYPGLGEIHKGKAVILSPYAKSVIPLPGKVWEEIIESFSGRGFQVFTNISGEEKPFPGTEPLRAELSEMRSILERAGTFIGIRSGLCDVVRTADCRKVAMYPDYNYCDTKWKATDMYAIEGFENIVVKEGFIWKN